MRTFGFATGAVLLLAVLTVVLCVMGGVFDFTPGGTESPPVTAPPAEDTAAPPAPVGTPPTAETPAAVPTPTPTEAIPMWQISAIAGKGGSLSPSGLVEAADGSDVTFTVTPDEGYVLSELKIDGETVGAADTYTFTRVGENHSVYAVFRLAPVETPAAVQTPSSPTDIG